MDINENLMEQIEQFPEDIRDLALSIMHELVQNYKSDDQIEKFILSEIREIV
jgi:hypothetical protein